MTIFETMVEYDEETMDLYVHLTNAPALAKGYGNPKTRQTRIVQCDLNDYGEIVGVRIRNMKLPSKTRVAV